MNIFNRKFIALAAAFTFCLGAFAQDASESTLVRRGANRENRLNQASQGMASGSMASRTRRGELQPENASTDVSTRMQSFYEESPMSDADLQWMRVIYRQIDLKEPKNASLYYPEDVIDGQENLFRIILRLVLNNNIQAYEYLDGREVFNEQNQLKIKDMLDRFYIPATEAKGSTEKNPRYEIEESDVPTNEVLSYYIIERWEFDSRSNRMKTRVEAICPVLHRAGEWGGDEIKYPMFWVKMENLRPYLAQQDIFIDDDNNLAKYSYDDFFAMNMYQGDIYKTRNLMNKSMVQLYPDPDDLKRAQDSIQNRLDTFDKNIWVPSREEVIAMREAREAAELAAEGDSIVIKSRDNKDSKPARARTSRAKKEKSESPRAKQPKAPKQDNSNNAVRSVRRRK